MAAKATGFFLRELAGAASGRGSLSRAAGLDAASLNAILMLGISCLKVGAPVRAARILRGLTALEPRVPIFHVYLALAGERCGDLESAILACDRALEAGRHRPSAGGAEAFLIRARIRARIGRIDQARADLESARLLELGPGSAQRAELTRIERILEARSS